MLRKIPPPEAGTAGQAEIPSRDDLCPVAFCQLLGSAKIAPQGVRSTRFAGVLGRGQPGPRSGRPISLDRYSLLANG